MSALSLNENDNLLCKNLAKNKEAKDSDGSDESESEIDLVTTNRQQDSLALDYSSSNNNNNNIQQKNNHMIENCDKSMQ